ncbi:hypothetical protein CWI38_0547p0020 [Hamiltosporidium tvaerminnensis]|uniref:Uncharacterized protein n=2 Tax=Hamiltosporidium TaxID=1176354 RepID=A0A4Q9LYP1_9MICR|nr:hypothetical protein CWI38_0547p0020 [Hamiltosporidium tvaerminnensis]
MITAFILLLKKSLSSNSENITENLSEYASVMNEESHDSQLLSSVFFLKDEEIGKQDDFEVNFEDHIFDYTDIASIYEDKMLSDPYSHMNFDQANVPKDGSQVVKETANNLGKKDLISDNSKAKIDKIDTTEKTVLNIPKREEIKDGPLQHGTIGKFCSVVNHNCSISCQECSYEISKETHDEKNEEIHEYNDYTMVKSSSKRKGPKTRNFTLGINKSVKKFFRINLSHQNMKSNIKNFEHQAAVDFLNNLHREIKIIHQDILPDNSKSEDKVWFEKKFKKKINSIKINGIKTYEDWVSNLKFSKKIVSYEKTFMENSSIEEKNSFLVRFKLKKFEEYISEISKYYILSEIPFFIYSYNKGSIHIKEGYVFYVSFMLKLLEVCYSNNERFDRLNDQFCFKYNNNIILFRLIFYNMLSGIKDFDCKKNFYIVISSLIYFNDIGGIKKTRYKKKIYCIQLNILLHSVFLQSSIDKDVNKAIEFCKSTVLNAIESSNSYEKDCFKKFFLHLRDIDLIREYTKIYSLMKNQALCEKVNLVFDEDSENLLIKYSKEGTYANENREYIKDLFTLETLITCLNSKLVYCRYKLRDNFNFCGKKDFWKTLNAELQKSLNQ